MIRRIYIAVALVALCALPPVFAQPFDPNVAFEGARVVGGALCSGDGDPQVYACYAVVAKDGSRYLAMVDDKGLAKVYAVPDKEVLEEKDFTLVWRRGTHV